MQRAAQFAIPIFARALSWWRLDTRVVGAENVPCSGPVLIAARHYHHLFDGLALLQAIPRPISILVTLDWVRGRAMRVLMAWATRTARWPALLRPDALHRADSAQALSPFSSSDVARYRRQALNDAIDLLVEGSALVVFPEGYPNIDPHYTPKIHPHQFLRFRSGFATILALAERRLAVRIPVLPVGIHYVPGPSRWTVHVKFGNPTFLQDHRSRAALTRHVQQQVERLSQRLNEPD
jgi:putative membrane protein